MKSLLRDNGGAEWKCGKCGFAFEIRHAGKPVVFGFMINNCPNCGIAFHKWKDRNKNKSYDGN